MRLGEGRVPVERTEEHGIFIWWEMKETERRKERKGIVGKEKGSADVAGAGSRSIHSSPYCINDKTKELR